jgi:plasmid stabilization system protein ParE
MRVIYHPDAATELLEAAQFYESKLPGLGSEFLDEIDRAVSVIAGAPERSAVVRGNIRRFPVRRFPYGIYYRVLPDVVRILVIQHHSRHPDLGMDRT